VIGALSSMTVGYVNATPTSFTFCDSDRCVILQGYFSFDSRNNVTTTTCDLGNQTYCHLFIRGFTFAAGMNDTDTKVSKIVSDYWQQNYPNGTSVPPA
jgi:hypothetical protein